MSIIIDANRTGDFSPPISGHAPMILEFTRSRKTKVVVGGKLLQEIMKSKLSILVAEWARIGSLMRIDDREVDAEEQHVRTLTIQSDDPHVIALARLSHCNVIYTDDAALMRDLKNPSISNRKRKIVTSNTKARVARVVILRFCCQG